MPEKIQASFTVLACIFELTGAFMVSPVFETGAFNSASLRLVFTVPFLSTGPSPLFQSRSDYCEQRFRPYSLIRQFADTGHRVVHIALNGQRQVFIQPEVDALDLER